MTMPVPLESGETLLWEGRPAADLHFGIETWATGILGGFVVAGFAATGAIMGSVLPLVLMGLGVAAAIVVAFPLYDQWLRARTRYVLTDRRAFILGPPAGVRLPQDTEGWRLTDPDRIELTRGPPDTVRFAWRPSTRQGRLARRTGGPPVGFVRIAEGEKVLALLQEMARCNRDRR